MRKRYKSGLFPGKDIRVDFSRKRYKSGLFPGNQEGRRPRRRGE